MLLDEQLSFWPGDWRLLTFGTLWGAWQGAGMLAARGADSSEVFGGTLFGMSAGSLLAAGLQQTTDYSGLEDLLLMSGAIWGTWLGGWMPYAFDFGDDEAPVWGALLLGDAGLILDGLVLSELVGVEPATLGWVQLGGLGGMAVGTSLGIAIGLSDRSLAVAMLIGSVAGLAAGGVGSRLLRGDEGGAAKRARADETTERAASLTAPGEDQDVAPAVHWPAGLQVEPLLSWLPDRRHEAPRPVLGVTIGE